VAEPILDLSGYKAMWLFAAFDLPVGTKAARKAYTGFRKALLREGFMMLQYSVYARYCPGEESSEAVRRHVRWALPDAGRVRLFAVTDRQFEKMEVFDGKTRERVEDPPAQFMLF
jgi:CRISPR-associated protein Cas2